jgi:glycosyltransferase involved in cell wall biosynthesis
MYKSTNNIGKLNGLTILRFTHAYTSAGGIEQYLKDINNALLQRNKMTILQLELPEHGNENCEAREEIGCGVLIKIPMTVQIIAPANARRESSFLIVKHKLKNIIRDKILYNPVLSIFTRKLFINKNYSLYNREPLNAAEKAREIFNNYDVSLVIIHLGGGLGSAQIIHEAQQKKIPCLIFNHFSNNWFKRAGFREQIVNAAGIGGVSSKDIPKFIKGFYTNLSDGIDTEFFSKHCAESSSYCFDAPVILLPARIVPEKGHNDLINAANKLKKAGLKFKVVLAGREDFPDYKLELGNLINQYGLTEDIHFAGQLTIRALRDLYAASSVVVLPSYNEGLGRVLIEAQAMEVPTVAYDVGGISEALVNNKTGYLIKKGDINTLFLRIKKLLLDNSNKIAMGQAGRAFAEQHFSFSVFAQRHEEWYLSALEK